MIGGEISFNPLQTYATLGKLYHSILLMVLRKLFSSYENKHEESKCKCISLVHLPRQYGAII